MDKQFPSRADILRNLSAQDFLNFGVQQITYIRPADQDGAMGYAIHAADGTPLAFHPQEGAACALSRQNDLEPMRLH
jgi:hypothetical protein